MFLQFYYLCIIMKLSINSRYKIMKYEYLHSGDAAAAPLVATKIFR